MKRSKTIDGMKALAIIAVVLYHLGFAKYGFLGVDVFFVICGFLTTKTVLKEHFGIVSFLIERIRRIYPLVLIAGVFVLIIGYWGMLPDDFENVSEQVIAANVLSENILSAITTKNYWDVVNDYKPLMHMWYVGILFEFYIIYPIITKLLKKGRGGGIACLAVLSLIAYTFPFATSSDKFYYLPFRFFEFAAGVLVCIYAVHKESVNTFYIAIVTIALLLFANFMEVPTQARLIATVAFTALILITYPRQKETLFENKVLSVIGLRCYSIFVWHQVILAFYRYFFTDDISFTFVVIYICLIGFISEISYCLIEQRAAKIKLKYFVLLFLFSTVCSLYVFSCAGVVRDVPELDIYRSNAHRGMHAEYCDRILKYNHEFLNNGSPKVLIVGDSFARDWGNILLEAGIQIDMTYSYGFSEKLLGKIKQADYIFISFRDRDIKYDDLAIYMFETSAKVYNVGTKNFGKSNGIIYKNRNKKDYFKQFVEVDEKTLQLSGMQKNLWKENYIDMIAPVSVSYGFVRVFTDDNKFISQDCRHLTQAGARYYAKILNIRGIFQNETIIPIS